MNEIEITVRGVTMLVRYDHAQNIESIWIDGADDLLPLLADSPALKEIDAAMDKAIREEKRDIEDSFNELLVMDNVSRARDMNAER